MGYHGDVENLYFYLQLVVNRIEMNDYPFTKLVIDNQLSEQEYEDLLTFLEQLNEQYQAQKEGGLLHYQSLLLHFVGMLNQKLEPIETMYALKKEGLYPSLMDVFLYHHEQNFR